MEWKIPLFKIYWDEEDIAAVNKAIRRGMSWTIGPEIEEFEAELSKYLKIKYCLTFSSGTSALHAVLLACGIGPGDEVIVPSFTFIATANAALFVGAKPVFADIEEKTYSLDPKDVERKITARTKAIIPIHFGGCPCLLNELKDTAHRHNVLLIEDAAEALGASINGVKVGSIGDASILSFCQNKTITTGEGGAVVTNSRDVYEKLKLIRSHGRAESADYFSSTEIMDYITLGYNFRMPTMVAALGLAQLNKLDKLVEIRRRNSERMSDKLSGSNVKIIPTPQEGYHHVYQMYTICVPDGKRDGLMKHLASHGIMSKVFFSPVHKTHFYKNELHYDCALPVTEKASRQALTLPMYATLSEGEIDTVASHVTEYLTKAK